MRHPSFQKRALFYVVFEGLMRDTSEEPRLILQNFLMRNAPAQEAPGFSTFIFTVVVVLSHKPFLELRLFRAPKGFRV